MKTSYLFPNSFKIVGWVLLIPGTILGLLVLFQSFEISYLDAQVFTLFKVKSIFDSQPISGHLIDNNFTNELAAVIFLVGAILVGFSKEKQEDEYITKIRLESLVWATYLNYGFLLIGLVLVYDTQFLTFMALNMFTLLIFFIIRFHVVLNQNQFSVKAHAE